MTDPAFVAGVISGLMAGSLVLLAYTRIRRRFARRREIAEWDERSYAPPAVTTITVNRRREINL